LNKASTGGYGGDVLGNLHSSLNESALCASLHNKALPESLMGHNKVTSSNIVILEELVVVQFLYNFHIFMEAEHPSQHTIVHILN
jgi:hypothetical protein